MRDRVTRLLITICRIRPRSTFDVLFLIGSGLLILASVGALGNADPLGDDPLVHLAIIRHLAVSFPNLQWDPHLFNGYSPAVGFPWAAYSFPALLVALGGDPISVFHISFLIFFFLLGFSVYYFTRKIEAPRIVAVALPILLWSTNTYWNISIWGGAYARVFSLPYMFTALALTYEYVTMLNRGEGFLWKYFLLLSFWTLTFLSDVYMAVIAGGVAVLFLLLSAGWKNPLSGISRLAAVFLPVLGLTAWYLSPLITHFLAISPLRNDVTPNQVSQLFLSAPPFTSSLNSAYIPSLAALVIPAAILARRELSRNLVRYGLGAMIFSLSIFSVYFFIMGWIPPLWPYLPRLMATYDSNNALSYTFIMLLAAIFSMLKRTAINKFPSWLPPLFLLLIAVNASIIIPAVKPADWNLLTNDLHDAFAKNVSLSDGYRESLDGRLLTRWLPYYYPDSQQTGGRAYSLDLNPFYQSWFQTEVFYKDDLGTLNLVYLEDQPLKNVSQYIGSTDNFAETRYWLDWYGSSTVVLAPALYPVDNTVAGYSNRSAAFSTSIVSTNYGPLAFVKYNEPTPILTATNAPTIGFYSLQQDALNQYDTLLALLSYLGLSSKYVVPIYLSSLDNVKAESFDLITTDYSTYSHQPDLFNTLQAQGMTILILAPNYLSSLLAQGTTGAYDLVSLIPSIIKLKTMYSTLRATYPVRTLSPSSQDWIQGYERNANGTITRNQSNVTVSLNIPDTTSSAQFNIDHTLPNPIPLTSQLQVGLSVKTDTDATIGQVFTSQNFTSNFVGDDQKVAPGTWVNLQAPFSNFATWQNTNSKFATAGKFTIALSIPPGHSKATIQIRNVSLTVPRTTILQLSSPVPMSSDGFLQVAPMQSNSSIILSDDMGNLDGAHEIIGNGQRSATLPLPEFTSEANRSFTRIIVAGSTLAQQVSVSLFQRPGWTSVQNNWITNQDLNISSVQGGFHGLIWKETYAPNWQVVARDSGGRQVSLQYYSAGPGMVYIPIGDLALASVRIDYMIFTPTNIALIGLAISTIVVLVAFRRRLYAIGVRTRNTSSLLTDSKG